MGIKENTAFAEYHHQEVSTDIAELIGEAILSDKFKEGELKGGEI